mmetsp:Transcript_2032/g.4586  ORF Transcript_2032/g.4586 Transcript_2032/m.4586 type:complete len:261 (+) Transcript_2032:180-962(+)
MGSFKGRFGKGLAGRGIAARCICARSALLEGFAQCLDKVVDILNPGRDADEAIRDAHLKPVLLQHVRVGHHRAGRDDALRGAQVLAQAPRPLDCVHQLRPGLRATDDVKPQHASMKAIAMVLVCQGLLRVRSKAWVHHLGHLRVLLQELRNRHSTLALLPNTQRQGLRSLHHEEGCEGVDDVPVDVLHPFDLLSKLLGLGDDSSCCHHVVPLVVLGETLNHHVSTVVKRSADDWRRKGGIDHVVGPSFLGDLGDGLEVTE